jgi:hypothetical protein
MNSSFSGASSAPAPRADALSCRADMRGASQGGDDFARVLRDKAGVRDGAGRRDDAARREAGARRDPGRRDVAEDDGARDDAVQGDPAKRAAAKGEGDERGDELAAVCAAAESAPPPASSLAPFLLAAQPGGVSDITAPPGARGAVDESVAARAPLAQAPSSVLGAADAAASWQVHLPQALGSGLELRATRTAGSAQAQPGWALTIASPAHEAALLARHAPRLDERLRARALEVDHVRIERDDRQAGEEGA